MSISVISTYLKTKILVAADVSAIMQDFESFAGRFRIKYFTNQVKPNALESEVIYIPRETLGHQSS